ncbi:response regulator [Bdellovibrionota bacterium FG-2]
MTTPKELITFQKYLKKRSILIVNEGATTRAMLSKTLNELGARGDLIHLASTWQEAQELMPSVVPHIVVSDFNLGEHSGLSLIELQREALKAVQAEKEGLFIIITGNTSQTAIAQAAEEEVDAYILKPFNLKGLRSALVAAVMAKIHPSEYVSLIQKGKDALFVGDFTTALQLFDGAIELNPKPALAYFYMGQTKLLQNTLTAAEQDFRQGLEFCKIHYKCLVGLFDILMKQNREAEAYLVVRKIATYFPSNPKRLYQILRLTVGLKEFEDLQDYYQAFCNLPVRAKDLTLQMCSALIVAGRYFLRGVDPKKGIVFLQDAAVSCAGLSHLLREIILACVEFEEFDLARKTLARFSPQDQALGTFAACDLLIRSKTESGLAVMKLGLKYLDKKVYDPVLFEVVIHHLILNDSRPRAQNLLLEAQRLFPTHRFDLPAAPQGAVPQKVKTSKDPRP